MPDTGGRYFFDIPKLPLHQSILEFAFQADCEVIAQERDLSQQEGLSLHGYYSPLKALQHLVGDTGLAVEFVDEANAYVIRALPVQPSVEIVSEASRIEEILVTGHRYPLRYQTIVSSEHQYGSALFDPTRAHNILPDTVLADSNSDSLVEALRYISSATPSDGFADSNDDYFIRGFPRQNTYIDGLRLSNSTAIKIVPDTVERLDVLKGPSMLFYGQSSAGGVVDVMKRKPAPEDRLRAELMLGESTRSRLFAEVNKGQLIGKLNFLLMGMDDRQQGNADRQSQHRQMVNIRGQGQRQERLTYGASYEYQYLNKTTTQAQPIFSNDSQFLPYRGRDFINQAEDGFSASAELIEGSVNFHIKPEWRLQSNFLWQREIRDGVRIDSHFLTDTPVLLAPNPLRPRVGVATIMGQMAAPLWQIDSHYIFGPLESVYDQHETENARSGNLVLYGRLSANTVEHRLIAGIDFYSQTLHQEFAVEERTWSKEPVFSKTILENPQQALLTTLRQQPPATRSITSKARKVTRDDWGSYFQVRSNWTTAWNTSLGWRYSQFYDTRREIDGSNPDLEGAYEDWLLQAGSSWLLTDTISLYVNYSETLNLNYLVDDFDRFVEQPERSHQYELGVKWQARDAKALGTISVFSIANSSINTVEFASGYRTLQTPQKRKVQGIEIDLTWRMNAWAEWIVSGALMRNELSEQNSETRYARMIADNTLGILGRFRLSDTWTSYLGLNYVSDRSIDGVGLAKLGKYTLIDLTLEKVLVINAGEWRLRAQVKNLLDEYHPSAAIPGARVNTSNDRHALIELTYELSE